MFATLPSDDDPQLRLDVSFNIGRKSNPYAKHINRGRMHALDQHREQIDTNYPLMDWDYQPKGQCRVALHWDGDVGDPSQWAEVYLWIAENRQRLIEVLTPYIEDILQDES